MTMEMKLSQQDRNLLKNLTRSLDNLAISLGKNQSQAPKSPKRLSEPVELSEESMRFIAEVSEGGLELRKVNPEGNG